MHWGKRSTAISPANGEREKITKSGVVATKRGNQECERAQSLVNMGSFIRGKLRSETNAHRCAPSTKAEGSRFSSEVSWKCSFLISALCSLRHKPTAGRRSFKNIRQTRRVKHNDIKNGLSGELLMSTDGCHVGVDTRKRIDIFEPEALHSINLKREFRGFDLECTSHAVF